MVVGEDRRADMAGATGGGEVARGGEDGVGGVVGVLIAGAVGVHPVARPGGWEELHPALGAGAGDAEVAAIVGLDLVDRGEHLPGDSVGGAGGLVERQQEGGHAEAFDVELGNRTDGGAERTGERGCQRGGQRRGLRGELGGRTVLGGAARLVLGAARVAPGREGLRVGRRARWLLGRSLAALCLHFGRRAGVAGAGRRRSRRRRGCRGRRWLGAAGTGRARFGGCAGLGRAAGFGGALARGFAFGRGRRDGCRRGRRGFAREREGSCGVRSGGGWRRGRQHRCQDGRQTRDERRARPSQERCGGSCGGHLAVVRAGVIRRAGS